MFTESRRQSSTTVRMPGGGVERLEGPRGGGVDVHAWRRGKFPLEVGAGSVEKAVAEDDAVGREHGLLE